MSINIDIGPITRLEGHLNVQTSIKNNIIVDAKCQGEMFRGFEAILKGRDPLDAQQITQRICGVCPYAHAIASCYAQENAYDITPPPNGRIIQNLIQGANHLYDYLLSFYQLAAFDFIDVTSVLDYKGKDSDLIKLKKWVQTELKSDKTFPASPFLPRLSGEYITDPEINIELLKNYVDAIAIQQKANKASALFGGKFPHATAIFPSGCTQQITHDLITQYQELLHEVTTFLNEKYFHDLNALANIFPDYWNIGISSGGFMSYGLLPLGPEHHADRLFSEGILFGDDINDIQYSNITEDVHYSKYEPAELLKIHENSIKPAPHKTGAYSWIKAPRYDEKIVEVGPVARVMIEYYRGNNSVVKKYVNTLMTQHNKSIDKFNSVIGRHLSRGICALTIAEFLLQETERLEVGQPCISEFSIPDEAEGYGVTEASRGGLLHYIRIKNKKIDKYECVVPTTWNCSPKDEKGQPGALESALIGTKISKPEEQIEAGRIVRSFDPCLACAVH